MNLITARFNQLFILFLLVFSFIYAQERKNAGASKIEGTITDSQNNNPVEYATIILFNAKDSTQVTGAVSTTSGNFTIEPVEAGKYYVTASYIGFENYKSKVFEVVKGKTFNLGKITLTPKSIAMNEVSVKSGRVPISYQIDKKVINVSENFSTISGTAVEVLENVPSVTVDIDGNVSLRGSGNFTVLIDGRPTILDGNTALQQIPASSIENIEIITNPSAKYDPEGTAGIINVILQKNKSKGISGVASLNAGTKDKYGTDLLTDYKFNNTQINFGLNYNKRNMSAVENSENWTNNNNIYSYYNSDGNSYRKGEQFGLRSSITWDLGDKKILSLGTKYNNRKMSDNSVLNYYEWTSLSTNKNYYNSLNNGSRDGSEYQITGSYNHPFNDKGHELSLEADFESEDGNDITVNNLLSANQLIDGKKTYESGPGNELTTKIDYQLPLTEVSKFEAGYQGRLELNKEETDLETFNALTNSFEKNPLFKNDIKYYTNNFALYSLYSNKFSDLGIKLGVRGEYTGRKVEITEQDKQYSIDDWNVFPTAHFSYDFGSGNQLMTSYTRRINRPRGWEFEPFLTWVDAYNVRIGNPSLLPEFIDSYELGFQKIIGNSLLSIDAYYRLTKNKIDRIKSYYSDNVTLQTPMNIGKDYAIGTEMFINFDPIDKWNVNLMGNFYNYQIKGSYNTESFDKNSFNWNVRFNNTVKFSSETMLQVNLMYNSPTVSSQGNREGYVSTNVALKQNLIGNLLTATLQIRDLFSAASNKDINESFDFYSYRYFKREAPVVMLNFRFNFNNYKDSERSSNNDGMDGDNLSD